MSALFNLPYVGNVAQWAIMMSAPFAIEAYGPYQRRTNRTRTTILSTDGPLDISVPVHMGHQLQYKDVRLNYDTEWARQHIYALKTAYNSTPYFEYFEEDFRALYFKQHEFLWDFNMELMHLIADLCGIRLTYSLTQTFTQAPDGMEDLRIAIEPKFANRINDLCKQEPYTQVFAKPYTSKNFTPWLSMLDLLFNMGPESRVVLRNMMAK